VGVLGTVIQVPVLAMLHTGEHVLFGRAIAFELVRDDHPRDVSQPFEQLAEKLLRCSLVALTLHQDVEHVAILIHRPPQVVPFAVNGEKHLVQVPLVTWSRPVMPELIRIPLPELQTPLADGFVGHDDPAGEQQLLDIAVAETEAKVGPPGAVTRKFSVSSKSLFIKDFE
jgi:hypothetical protein